VSATKGTWRLGTADELDWVMGPGVVAVTLGAWSAPEEIGMRLF